jgi:hypothetical protein
MKNIILKLENDAPDMLSEKIFRVGWMPGTANAEARNWKSPPG